MKDDLLFLGVGVAKAGERTVVRRERRQKVRESMVARPRRPTTKEAGLDYFNVEAAAYGVDRRLERH
jgi:hypothetical protein